MSAIEGIRSPDTNPEEDIENSNEKAGETTWNDVADLKDQIVQLEASVNGQLESNSSQALRNENITDARGQLLEVYSKKQPYRRHQRKKNRRRKANRSYETVRPRTYQYYLQLEQCRN